jgi:hypothetical protein
LDVGSLGSQDRDLATDNVGGREVHERDAAGALAVVLVDALGGCRNAEAAVNRVQSKNLVTRRLSDDLFRTHLATLFASS